MTKESVGEPRRLFTTWDYWLQAEREEQERWRLYLKPKLDAIVNSFGTGE